MSKTQNNSNSEITSGMKEQRNTKGKNTNLRVTIYNLLVFIIVAGGFYWRMQFKLLIDSIY